MMMAYALHVPRQSTACATLASWPRWIGIERGATWTRTTLALALDQLWRPIARMPQLLDQRLHQAPSDKAGILKDRRRGRCSKLTVRRLTRCGILRPKTQSVRWASPRLWDFSSGWWWADASDSAR